MVFISKKGLCGLPHNGVRRSSLARLMNVANVYLEVARAIEAVANVQPVPADWDFSTVNDGVQGMTFIATAVQSPGLPESGPGS